MNISDLWDWLFMWQMFRNFMASVAPFIMVIVAVAVAGFLLRMLVDIFMRRRSE